MTKQFTPNDGDFQEETIARNERFLKRHAPKLSQAISSIVPALMFSAFRKMLRCTHLLPSNSEAIISDGFSQQSQNNQTTSCCIFGGCTVDLRGRHV